MLRLRVPSVAAVLLMVATMLAACGSSGKKAAAPTTAAPTTAAPSAATSTSVAPAALTASFRGVTATSIKVGIVTIDYKCIQQFVDYNFGNQPAIDQVLINNLNNHGGILGRKIDPVFRSYCPIGNSQALTVCTSYTEDDKVFAVLGVFYDTTGDAQLCLSRDHQTILLGHELLDQWISKSPPGLMVTPDITAERRSTVLLNLLKSSGTLTGKKVATLADQDSAASVTSVIKPGLDAMGVSQGSAAVLTVTGSDTSAAQAQLDSFIEKWKGEGVNGLILAGLNVSSEQFVNKIKKAMPDLLLMTDGESSAQQGGEDDTAAKMNPNPYDGMLTANGLTDLEQWQGAWLQQCVKTYQDNGGQTVIGPDKIQPGPDGKRVLVWSAVRDFCSELSMFQQIAEKAGPNLTNATWTQAVNNYGEITLEPPFASVHTGKYDAEDAFRLVSFDPTLGPKGDFKALGPLLDASK